MLIIWTNSVLACVLKITNNMYKEIESIEKYEGVGERFRKCDTRLLELRNRLYWKAVKNIVIEKWNGKNCKVIFFLGLNILQQNSLYTKFKCILDEFVLFVDLNKTKYTNIILWSSLFNNRKSLCMQSLIICTIVLFYSS